MSGQFSRHGADHFADRGMPAAGREILRFGQRAAEDEQQRDDQAADHQRDAPAPAVHLIGVSVMASTIPTIAASDDGRLLTGGLPADEKPFAARRGDLGQVHGYAADLNPGGESLQQAAGENQYRRDHPDGRVAGHAGDRGGADRHQPERQQESLAASVVIDVRAEHDRAERTHQVPGAKRHQRHHQRRELAAARKERAADGDGVIAEHHEVVHLEEIAARDANDRPGFRFRLHGGDAEFIRSSDGMHTIATGQMATAGKRQAPHLACRSDARRLNSTTPRRNDQWINLRNLPEALRRFNVNGRRLGWS